MIDLLLPYYGDSALAQQTVLSVVRQTSDDWRLVVVDDNYPDPKFGQWVMDLGHAQVSYLRNEANLGVNANFRRCVELATSEHLAIIGGDDLLLPNYIETINGCLRRHPEVALVQPGVRVVNAAGNPARPLPDRVKRRIAPRGTGERIASGEPLAKSLMLGNWMYFPAVAWRRDLLQQHLFRTGLHTALDLALLLDLTLEGREFLVTDVEAFVYRRHRESASAIEALSTARFKEEGAIYRVAARRCEQLGWQAAARAARLHPTSRIHAALLIPRALAAGRGHAVLDLAGHALGRTNR